MALSDRLYDKRKLAALELEQVIKEYQLNGESDKVEAIIRELCQDFAYAARNPNYRNGGLIGLAAVSIALGPVDLPRYLDDIVQPILACFGDSDSRVRYYACESLYNTAKVAKGELLQYFNEIFDILCKLVADPEESVRNGADLVNRLVRDIVAEKACSYTFQIQRSLRDVPPAVHIDASGPGVQVVTPQAPNKFTLSSFIPLLVERIYVINPNTRMFLVQWIMLLDSLPDLELIAYLPMFLDGLLQFLSDPSIEVRTQTKVVLDGFFKEIEELSQLKNRSTVEDNDVDHEGSSLNAGLYTVGKDTFVDYSRIIETLLDNLDSSNEDIRLMVLHGIQVFLDVSTESLLAHLARLVSVLLPVLSDENELVRNESRQISDAILKHIKKFSPKKTEIATAISSLTLQFLSTEIDTRVAALDWLSTLLQVLGSDLNDGTLLSLLKPLNDPSDQVVAKTVKLLAQVLKTAESGRFGAILKILVNFFASEPDLLASRGKSIWLQVCVSLDAKRVYYHLASILTETLVDPDSTNFVRQMVQNINSNLLVAPELKDMRNTLRDLSQPTGANLFVTLFRCWCCSPIAAFSLCLLAQAYEHAFAVLQIICSQDVTVDLLVQIDKLVQLIESPVFAQLRLQLLEFSTYPYLYRCLYGLLMILPQSNAFGILSRRLNSISGIASTPALLETATSIRKKNHASIDWKSLLDEFCRVNGGK